MPIRIVVLLCHGNLERRRRMQNEETGSRQAIALSFLHSAFAFCVLNFHGRSHDSLPAYAAITSSIFGGCFVTDVSPYCAPMSAPKWRPRASIMSRNDFLAMNVSASFDFGS